MALSEFMAMEDAYRALHPLDPAARRRALLWLTDVLQISGRLPEAVTAPGASESDGDEQSAPEPRRRRKAAAAPTDRRRRVASEPAPRGVGSRTTRAASAAEPVRPRRSRNRVATPDDAGTGDQQRAYRRMPPADDVLAAYRQAGTLTGLAEHFGVPRHTVQGWARRLRREGHAIGRG